MDTSSALYWLFLNFLSMIVLAFYSMQEMACVSLNRIRLHYYVSKGIKQAIWLNYLLQNPSRLFGTTLIFVNCAMIVGSEYAREFYISLGLSPDLAPLTQVALVVVFAELAPMFAARRYAEHVAMLGAPIVYTTARLITPLLWSIGLISRFSNYIFGGKKEEEEVVLNQADLHQILNMQEEEQAFDTEGEFFNAISSNILSLREKEAKQVMIPIAQVSMLPANSLVAQAPKLFRKPDVNYIPLYHRDINHIVGIINPRNLTRATDTKRVRDYARPPWFVTQNTKAMQILKEFRRNNQNVAVVIDEEGLAVGIITLNNLITEIFGKVPENSNSPKAVKPVVIERSFPGDMSVADFNARFDVVLDEEGEITLAELMEKALGHHPIVGEFVYIQPFELEVKEASLLEIKTISVTTRIG